MKVRQMREVIQAFATLHKDAGDERTADALHRFAHVLDIRGRFDVSDLVGRIRQARAEVSRAKR